jgi:hypothetical protein
MSLCNILLSDVHGYDFDLFYVPFRVIINLTLTSDQWLWSWPFCTSSMHISKGFFLDKTTKIWSLKDKCCCSKKYMYLVYVIKCNSTMVIVKIIISQLTQRLLENWCTSLYTCTSRIKDYMRYGQFYAPF